MPRSQLLYLNDISEAAGNIRTYVADLTFDKFKNDRMRVDAVVRNFEVIGEAVKNLSDDLKMQFPATDWKAVAGFRDTLIHGYFGIDLEILWDIIVNKIPVLQKEITAIIAHEKAKNT
ncbi:MAG: DUF86 domain-containing protein [Methanoregula sp.]|nr:DUF86 domain-containing protein [Methanoregula sp.]